VGVGAGVTLAVGWSRAVEAGPADRAVFSERAHELGVDFVHDHGGTGEHYFPEITGAGVALLDYDNDGDLDLHLVQGGSLVERGTAGPAGCDRLYRNQLVERGELRFVEVTPRAGLRACGYGMGAATGDIDNDGWVDLYLTNFGPNQLWRNNRDGTFTDVTASAGAGDPRWSVPAVFFDYDADGWLDLFVGNYADFRLASHKTCFAQGGYRDYCGPRSYDPEPDRLLRNRGDGTFEDVTLRARLDRAYGYALGAVAGDWNGDGRMDLYVANDGVENQLWINQGDGTFLDEALLAGCAVNGLGQPEASMGIASADFDNDGDLDLFLTHLTNETNTLYVNVGGAMFEDRTATSGLGAPSRKYTGFGTAFFDYDNDGWLDVLVANGAVNLAGVQDRTAPFPYHQANQLFRSRRDGTFEEVTAAGGPAFALSETSRGAAFGDLDNDGDVDVVVSNDGGPVRVLINEVGQDRPWLGLRLVLGEPGRDAIGAWVRVEPAGEAAQWRLVTTGGSYASASDPRLLVGLGSAATAAATVTVRWPDGGEEEWRGLRTGRYHVLVKTSGSTPGASVAPAPAAPDGGPPLPAANAAERAEGRR
jgi:hypothetical protein